MRKLFSGVKTVYGRKPRSRAEIAATYYAATYYVAA